MKKRLNQRQLQLIAQNIQRKRRRSHIQDLLVTFGIFIAVVASLFLIFFQVETVKDFSMLPNLQAGDRLIIGKYDEIERFDIIAFQVPGRKQQSIRRVIGLPGEELRYHEDILYVGTREIPERFLSEELIKAKDNAYQLTADFTTNDIRGVKNQRIPADYYLVLSDNRSFGIDSRDYGLVPKKDIFGVVVGIFLPIPRMMQL
ncbi:signal peptidase I [Enterococcus saigonensis]|uniref:Signal peptidase I n=1 Tax=Enterococcus saigonensis TaxID=1805431 RepID=A0A679IB38_9ENTE|nr:signal peptidase I [Enterococcus saigonensis]BCA86868.1 signal peptidase I [Enterococcus saigonensis]